MSTGRGNSNTFNAVHWTVSWGPGAGGSIIFDSIRIDYAPPPLPPPMPSRSCPHLPLGLPCNSTLKQARAAYRRLAKELHPDLGPPDEREERTRKMAVLNAAWDTIQKEGS